MDKSPSIVYTCGVELDRKIREKKAHVGVVGLGYVGLPLAAAFARRGFRVTGVEVDARRAASLRSGRSYIEDVSSAELRRLLADGSLEIRGDDAALSRLDAILICVQTPLRKTKEPDISNILAACARIARRLRRGQLIILESTTYPGTTEEAVRPALEAGGLKAGRDFWLAFSPERVDPGNKRWNIENTPKVVGGVNAASTKLGAALYAAVVARVVPVSSATAAELVKLLENTFRAVNIALVNELAQICDRLGLNVWEVVDAAATKPFGFMPFWPGPGIGGHCIPKDPQLLTWKMKTLNFEPRFITLASTVNGQMPAYTAARIARILNTDGKAVKGSRILVLGVAYKPGVGDQRESPAIDVMHLLAEDGAKVDYHDPFVAEVRAGGRVWRRRALSDSAVKAADLVVILTAHAGVDYRRVCRLARRVFDARNATVGMSGRIERL
ncbi:MAG: nucleotide sugar dehydrogenase [Elusimicrobia bacterium]|nr:nucleotide sugar dehydrogenase [Elusimicrobiota bacterium]